MNEREFCYWLQGMFEVADPKSLTEAQTAMIRDHLKLVFTKVTPERSVPDYKDLVRKAGELGGTQRPFMFPPIAIC